MSKWFPKYDSVPGEITDDMVAETIKKERVISLTLKQVNMYTLQRQWIPS